MKEVEAKINLLKQARSGREGRGGGGSTLSTAGRHAGRLDVARPDARVRACVRGVRGQIAVETKQPKLAALAGTSQAHLTGLAQSDQIAELLQARTNASAA